VDGEVVVNVINPDAETSKKEVGTGFAIAAYGARVGMGWNRKTFLCFMAWAWDDAESDPGHWFSDQKMREKFAEAVARG